MRKAAILPGQPTDYFGDAEWSQLMAHLESIARELQSFARENRLSFETDTRWPRIALSKRNWVKLRISEIRLAPSFLSWLRSDGIDGALRG